MISLHPIDLDIVSPNALYASRSARRFACHRSLAGLRAAWSPMVLVPVALLVFGCYALLVLTGVGPDSWQVRQCANGDLRPRSCQAASLDQGDAARPAGFARAGSPS
jgi:hypothetical protein